MDLKERQRKLIKKIGQLKEERIRASLADFKATLKEYEAKRDRAYKRMNDQRGAGDKVSAARSERAYKSCKKYAERLAAMVEGKEAQLKGNVVFTKDGKPGGRFKSADEYRKLK